ISLSFLIPQFPSHSVHFPLYFPWKCQELLNMQTHNGDSALHVAAANLNLEAVILLLKSSAIANLLNKNGQTPFDLSPPIRNIMLEHISSPPAWIDDHLAPSCQICE